MLLYICIGPNPYQHEIVVDPLTGGAEASPVNRIVWLGLFGLSAPFLWFRRQALPAMMLKLLPAAGFVRLVRLDDPLGPGPGGVHAPADPLCGQSGDLRGGRGRPGRQPPTASGDGDGVRPAGGHRHPVLDRGARSVDDPAGSGRHPFSQEHPGGGDAIGRLRLRDLRLVADRLATTDLLVERHHPGLGASGRQPVQDQHGAVRRPRLRHADHRFPDGPATHGAAGSDRHSRPDRREHRLRLAGLLSRDRRGSLGALRRHHLHPAHRGLGLRLGRVRQAPDPGLGLRRVLGHRPESAAQPADRRLVRPARRLHQRGAQRLPGSGGHHGPDWD